MSLSALSRPVLRPQYSSYLQRFLTIEGHVSKLRSTRFQLPCEKHVVLAHV